MLNFMAFNIRALSSMGAMTLSITTIRKMTFNRTGAMALRITTLSIMTLS